MCHVVKISFAIILYAIDLQFISFSLCDFAVTCYVFYFVTVRDAILVNILDLLSAQNVIALN